MTLSTPLRFGSLPFRKVWGGARLGPFLGKTFPDGPVGEVWQLVDRDGCASVVDGGPYDARSLAGLMLSERDALLGAAAATADGQFPLLVKLLDAALPLSIQVHPDASAARRLGSQSKDECWFVLEADQDSVVYMGLRDGVEPIEFAARAGHPGIVDLLQAHPVRRGQFVSVPAGTVHGLGSGITLIEVQDNADTTYRLFDWERRGLDGAPRPLHVEEALQSAAFGQPVVGPVDPRFEVVDGVNERAALLEVPGFRVELLRVNRGWERTTGEPARPVVYVVVAGRGALRTAGGDEVCRLARGETWLVPASVGAHRFEESDGELQVLAIEVMR